MKLLVTDLDGTLYPKKDFGNPRQLQHNIEAVQHWIAAGNEFAVATARGRHHYPVLCKELGVKPIYIGANGAAVLLESGETILKHFPAAVYIDLCRYIEDNNIDASVATGIDDMWVWSSKEHYPLESPFRHLFALDNIHILDLGNIDPKYNLERVQVFTWADKRDELKQAIIDRAYPVNVTTSDTDLIDIGPLDSSKGISILEISQRLGIDRKDIIVVGDSENDLPMFEVTEKSYCIEHAEPPVLKMANHVVKSVEEVVDLELLK